MAVSHGKNSTLSTPCRRPLANSEEHLPGRKFYGRRLGRPLSSSRQSAIKDLLPQLEVTRDKITQAGGLNPATLFPSAPDKIIFEIGFGNGEHLAEMMRQQPETGFIGAEPFKNGMAAFLKEIEDHEPKNIRAWMDDALLLVRSLSPESIDELYILNPDPWHKKRHFKRRIVNEDNLKEYARILKPGGKLVMTTDVIPLAEWMITKTVLNGSFEWTAEKADDWRLPPKNWIHTRYESKQAKGGTKMTYLIFQKKPLPNG